MQKFYPNVTSTGSALSTISFLLTGVTIMLGWNWFISPTGLAKINYLQAIGIDGLITFITTTDTGKFTIESRLKIADETVQTGLEFQVGVLVLLCTLHFISKLFGF